VRRRLLRSTAFVRAARRVVNKRPETAEAIRATLNALAEDAFQPKLRTHKLKGRLSGQLACTVEYHLRIVFRLVQHEGEEAILLETIGTHDEIY
jgi:mRNA-degrading endonuclease YafQ of YafQ-DinJ toxin-antitoxin module